LRPVVWSAAALRDVAGVHKYLAKFNPEVAQRVARALVQATDILAIHPFVGRSTSAGRRELVVAPYVIVYKVRGAETRILRVWHGAQDRPG
jgi:toxin ParE1/3/4